MAVGVVANVVMALASFPMAAPSLAETCLILAEGIRFNFLFTRTSEDCALELG